MNGQLLTKNNVIVVVPALNEAASIADVLRSLKEHGCTTVVISDGSVDATAAIARNVV
jgi:glycosyltransferase involved in cell wall biosynthesis